jgi:hypothetical protein
MVLANCREDITVEKVLSFPIGPIPTSLFHDDGTMRKTSKADLAHQLEQDVRLGSTVPFCLFDRVLNVISIKDIDDNGCQLKARDLIFYKIKCHLTKGSKPFCIY